MKSIDEIRRIRLKKLADEYGTASALAEVLGRSESQVSQWIKGSINSGTGKPRGMRSDTARWIEEVCGRPSGWMDHLDDETGHQDQAEITTQDNVIVIPMSSAWGSMGRGAPRPEHEIIVGGIPIGIDWLNHSLPRVSSKKNLAVITAFGDSMSPTFEDGDTLIVDRGVERVSEDGFFVASYNDELFIKRFQRRPTDKAILMKSDNPHYETIVIEDEHKSKFEVLGRVVWIWKGRKV